MPEQEKRKETRRDLWTLYAKAKKMLADGVPYMEVNARINETTGGSKPTQSNPKGKAGAYPGIASLEQALGIGDERGRGEKLAGSLGQVAEGLTLAHTGEIAGIGAELLDPILPGEQTYGGTRARVESAIDEHREEYPVSSFAGEMAGAMLPAVATKGKSLLPRLGGRAASGGMATHGIASGAAAPAGGIATRAIESGGRGLIQGAIGGAGYGHGAAEPGQRGEGALIGAAAGAGTGAVLGSGIPVGGALMRRLGLGATEQIPIVGHAVADNLRTRFPARNLANAELQGALRDAGVDPAVAARTLREMPSGSMLADVDPALARLARAAKTAFPSFDNSEGPVRRVLARFNNRGTRMAGSLRQTTGLPRGESADEVYKAGYEMWVKRHLEPLNLANPYVGGFGDMRLESTLKRNPILKDVLRNSEFYSEADWTKNKKLSFQALWDTRQRLQNRLGGNLVGGEREAINKSLKELDVIMNDMPGFAESQASFAALNVRRRAYTKGRELANKSEFEIKQEWDKTFAKNADGSRGMPDVERQTAFREGMLDRIEEDLLKRGTGGTRGGELASQAQEQTGLVGRLRVLFDEGLDGDVRYAQWVRSLNDEYRWGVTTQQLLGNSTTAQQQADLGLGAYVTTKRAALNELLSVAFEDPELRRQASRQVGELLMSTDVDAAEQMLMRLMEADALASMSKAGGRAAGEAGGSLARSMGANEQQPQQPMAPPPPPSAMTQSGGGGLLNDTTRRNQQSLMSL